MACSDYSDPLQFLTDFTGSHPFDAIYCPYFDVVGGPILALFVFGMLLLMYRIHGDSMIVPLVLVMMLGSIIVVQMPGLGVKVFLIGFMLGVPMAVMYIVWRGEGIG